MERERYTIYRLTSPSGRSYVGLTSQPLQVRWGQHVRRAAKGAHHPFCAAIRKYGAQALTVEVLRACDTLEEAFVAEIEEIAALLNPYNLSPEGAFDGPAGTSAAAELLRDPAWEAAYRAALSRGCRESEAHQAHAAELPALARDWRLANPREAYRIARRNLRLALKAERKNVNPKAWTDEDRKAQSERLLKRFAERTPSEKLKAKRAARVRAKHLWNARTPEQVADVSAKISDGMVAFNAQLPDEQRAERQAQLAAARARIDHDKRKRHQKVALIAYWTPERRAEVGARRRAAAAAKRGLANADV